MLIYWQYLTSYFLLCQSWKGRALYSNKCIHRGTQAEYSTFKNQPHFYFEILLFGPLSLILNSQMTIYKMHHIPNYLDRQQLIFTLLLIPVHSLTFKQYDTRTGTV